MIRKLLQTLVFMFIIASISCEENISNHIWFNHAREIEKSLNISQDPCEDFFEFACGGWKKNNPIQPGMQNWDAESVFKADLNEAMIEILETPSSQNESFAFESVKIIYNNCMDEETRKNVGFGSLPNLMEKIGGWLMASPRFTTQNITDRVMNNIVSYTKQIFGVGVLLDVTVSEKQWTKGNHRLYLEHAETPLEHILKNYNKESPQVTEYADSIKRILYTTPFKKIAPFRIDINKDVLDMVEFQMELIRIWGHLKKGKKAVMTIEDLQNWYDDLSPKPIADTTWLEFFNVILEPINISIEKETKIIIPNLDYVGQLAELLGNTPIRTINNFVGWSILYKFLKYLPKDLSKIYYKLNNIGKTIPSVPSERKLQCLEELPLQNIIKAEYVKRYLTTVRKNSVNEIIANISGSSKDFIGQTRWLNEQEQQVARDEIAKLKWDVGYPKWYDNTSAFIEHLHNFRYYGNYIENRRQINLLETKMIFSRLIKGFYGTQLFPEKVTDIHSEYRQDLNITLTADFLLRPIFNPNYPMAVNYGSIGTIVGHDIGHLFDSSNVHRDDDISKIWTAATRNEIDSRAACFQEQYNNYVVYTSANLTIKGNGEKTLDENIADYLGTKIAFLAYEKNKKPEDANELPNLVKYNDRQLFFLSFANGLCSSETPEYYKKMQDDISFVYSFNKFRVNGVVSNLKEFSDAFSCSMNSPMNPTHKCALYGPEA